MVINWWMLGVILYVAICYVLWAVRLVKYSCTTYFAFVHCMLMLSTQFMFLQLWCFDMYFGSVAQVVKYLFVYLTFWGCPCLYYYGDLYSISLMYIAWTHISIVSNREYIFWTDSFMWSLWPEPNKKIHSYKEDKMYRFITQHDR